ncbi:enoyl-CoA hydratase/isomerase family protein, partial [Streptomyces sp. NPDC127112]|uniref:enoyl-CoA hydratase/isomerase family protein n=1 Tax=Streptomyces sp. NPDC127112 TaxID=3345364 RepID=UPI0036384EB5
MTPATPSDEIRHRFENGVSWITLNRPDAMNALTWDQRERIIALLADASADPATRAVVLTATGKGFCAGADLRSGGGAPPPPPPAAADGARAIPRGRPRPP